jgi:hypothetical protein
MQFSQGRQNLPLGDDRVRFGDLVVGQAVDPGETLSVSVNVVKLVAA